jgi:hypothetical protein
MLVDDTLFGFGRFPSRGATSLLRRYVALHALCWKGRKRWHIFGIGRPGLKVAGLAVYLQLPETEKVAELAVQDI